MFGANSRNEATAKPTDPGPVPSSIEPEPTLFGQSLIFKIVIALILIVAVVAAADYALLKAPLPKTDGKVVLPGLQKQVTVFRDKWGVPYIFAENDHDLFFAQGYVHAQDRLWQMELNRRLAHGRLSEIFGPLTLKVDRLTRTLGFTRAARRDLEVCSPEAIKILQAYSDGVNANIKERSWRLPLEFRLLFFEPEPWKTLDSAVYLYLLALNGGKNWELEALRSRLAEKLGPEKANNLLPPYPAEHPVIVPPRMEKEARERLTKEPRFGLPPELQRAFAMGGASNSWAIAPGRSSTGHAMLANDMHLKLTVPSIWYEIGLQGGKYDVAGLSFPGVPLIVTGHNRNIAWGITFAYVDVMDLFAMEDRGASDKKKWKTIQENITVRGQDSPEILQVKQTPQGPIISDVLEVAQPGLALKWSAHDPADRFEASMKICQASNWEEFRQAVNHWTEPAVNLTYADVKGNIGYALGARVPVRKKGNGLVPSPGWDDAYGWKGYAPPEQNPSLYNPETGYIVSANNKIAADNYPYFLSADYAVGYRANSIDTYLSSKDTISPEDCRTLQGDDRFPAAEELREPLKGLEGANALEKEALRLLISWDGNLSKDSPGAAIAQALQYEILKRAFSDELGDLAPYYFGKGQHPLTASNGLMGKSHMLLRSIMKDPDSPWFDDVKTSKIENRTDVFRESLTATVEFLAAKQGKDPASWTWGALHVAPLTHPLGMIRPLDTFLNIGRFPIGGGVISVRQASYAPPGGFEVNAWTASNRHIFMLEDFDKTLSNIVPGQSGMVGSPHYKDQVDLWLGIEYHSLYFSRKIVESGAKSRLILASGP